jgi:hypothetical protein
MQQVPRGRCGFEGGSPRLSRPRFISRRTALSAAAFAASAVGFYRPEKKARSVSRFLILSRRATRVKRIGKSAASRIQYKNAHTSRGSSRNRGSLPIGLVRQSAAVSRVASKKRHSRTVASVAAVQRGRDTAGIRCRCADQARKPQLSRPGLHLYDRRQSAKRP